MCIEVTYYMKRWILAIILINLLMLIAGGRAYWRSKINWYNGSWWIRPKWIAPFTMPTPKIGKAMYLTTMIPTTSESFIPDRFNPEQSWVSVNLLVIFCSFSELLTQRRPRWRTLKDHVSYYHPEDLPQPTKWLPE